jgi:hypothetical protein
MFSNPLIAVQVKALAAFGWSPLDEHSMLGGGI